MNNKNKPCSDEEPGPTGIRGLAAQEAYNKTLLVCWDSLNNASSKGALRSGRELTELTGGNK